MEFLEALPAPVPVPVVIVQHMPPLFTRALAERLSARLPHPVKEADTDDILGSGSVWIAPGNRHLELVRRGGEYCSRLHDGPQENGCRPSVDVLFRSAARVAGSGAVAVVLTGMGHDGERGAREIHAAGGAIFAQDEPSSVVWGMPGSVVRAGIVRSVNPPGLLAHQVARQLGCAEARPAASRSARSTRSHPLWRAGRSGGSCRRQTTPRCRWRRRGR